MGRFQASGGCILFQYERPKGRRAALFPLGSRLSEDGGSIRLPDGQSFRFGEKVTIVFEAPPYRQDLDLACGPRPILVISREGRPPS